MTTEQWEQIEDLFNQAVALPPDKRASFINQICGTDENLRSEIISLLEADEDSHEILEKTMFPFVARLLENDYSHLLKKSDFASYKLIRLLGRGGMGAVFLAEDTRLERFVAIKILPSDSENKIEISKRFRQEAKAVSAISHQNVAHIYEFGEFEGTHFFAMEYVPGKTLREALDEKQISLSTAVEIGLQIARALEAAHAEEIVHRDIKPENVILRRRAIATKEVLIKVLDFGLAKLGEKKHHPNDSLLETTPGMIMGTAAYMAPEQIRGEVTDERTDLWSLGVLLYEMVCGKRPFEGETVSDVRAAILLKQPAPLPLESVLPQLSRIIEKALEKDAALRYQTAGKFIDDLRVLQRQVYDFLHSENESPSLPESVPRNLSRTKTNPNEKIITVQEPNKNYSRNSEASWNESVSSEKTKRNRVGVGLILAVIVFGIASIAYYSYVTRKENLHSIAVLPFVNGSGDPSQDYLSDGIAESLTNNLSQIPGIQVIAHNSSLKYKGKQTDFQEAAQTLGAETIVIGKIAPLGDRLIVSVEMINAADKTQMWGEQYNRVSSDFFQLQTDISREIAGKLQSRLAKVPEQSFAPQELSNPQAYEILLKGRFFNRKGGKENQLKAIEYFNQAIAAAPNYAPAYTDLATSYIILVNNSILNPQEFMPKAEAATRTALELDWNFADAHYALAQIKRSRREWAEAEREYQRAIELNPNYAKAHSGYAYFLIYQNRQAEALAENRRSRELDPLALSNHSDTGNIYYLSHRYNQAISELNKTLELDPNFPTAYVYLGYVYSAKTMYAEAIAAYRKAIALTGTTPSRQIFLGAAYAKAGESDQARAILVQLEKGDEYVSPTELAILYAALGMREQAFASLEKAYAAHDMQLQYLKVDPAFDSLRDDPRFADLLGRLGFA